jgi:hypothetical protein
MLTQYGPDLLVTCQNAVRLSGDLVSEWLKLYMFKGQTDAEAKGKAIAHWLSDHSAFKTHARPISRDELIAKGLSGIYALEQDQIEQDLFLSVHHTTAVKIIENNLGKTYLRSVEIMQAVIPTPPRPPAPPPPAQPPVPPKEPHG